ncbi:hypothetical protein HPB50_008718 [Hyalomma asiaticum]|uniref:Uncharacterized protein n=1 Tax=Hyalomma asiaticum TaxID=266040 RepID=A0ACB7TH74_HYAAI|nr:hypothetical protein HPB50_008718 [Hyalomma asiaticum]
MLCPGLADVCLMPLLALRLESRQMATYGAVYAVVETAVSLAYCLGEIQKVSMVKVLGIYFKCDGVAEATWQRALERAPGGNPYPAP